MKKNKEISSWIRTQKDQMRKLAVWDLNVLLIDHSLDACAMGYEAWCPEMTISARSTGCLVCLLHREICAMLAFLGCMMIEWR